MAIFRHHIPNSIAIDRPADVEYASLEELLAIPVVVRFQSKENFYRWSVSKDQLIAELDEGYKWWVVGFITETFSLPPWEPR